MAAAEAEARRADVGQRNVKLEVAYDGTDYHGFQLQAGGLATVQGELERSLGQIVGSPTRVVGAGRTDAGVHALGQVVSFRTDSELSTASLRRALNALLPRDIAVLTAAEVPPEFNARFSATSREYRYSILNRPVRDPLARHYVYHVPARLDEVAMATAAEELIGEHDFASFAGGGEVGSTVRRVLRAACRREQDTIVVDLAADAFLPHMVRNIVGTLLLAGRGKLDRLGFRAILRARDRRLAGPTAPAHGLCLMRVNY